ncbi:MAG: hypothetical protein ACQCXQ_06915 [Verrucomicrobiales bacterium]|nr:hypothetical protein [Verrucomicrobiota bacterium JB025]
MATLDLNDARNPYLFSALSAWARNDPAAAKAWLDTQPVAPGESRDYLLAGLIRGLSTSDPAAALKILLDAPASPERNGSLEFLLRAWTGISLEHAFAQVAALPDSLLREQAIGKLTANLTADQLEAAQSWAQSLPSPQERNAACTGIAARWSQSDPAAAADWAAGLQDPATRTTAFGEIGTRWARIDPLAAGDWLSARAGQPETDLAARSISWSTVGIDPDRAFSQVAAITRAGLRDETFEQVGRFWLSRDPQAAKRFLERESNMPPSIREKLLQSFE